MVIGRKVWRAKMFVMRKAKTTDVMNLGSNTTLLVKQVRGRHRAGRDDYVVKQYGGNVEDIAQKEREASRPLCW
jgi:hypothetical protein